MNLSTANPGTGSNYHGEGSRELEERKELFERKE